MTIFRRAMLLALLAVSPAAAQTRIVRVRSQILGEERMVHVNLPPNYELARRKYPVIYLLDGHVRPFFDITVASAAYNLTNDPTGYTPPPQIVVGVDHRERGVDLGRNQELFTRFLVEELVPFIDREYRTTPFRTLIGHSLGGRFALMTLCRAPGVFPAVVAISSAGGDSTATSALEQCIATAFKAEGTAQRHLVLSAGDGETRIRAGMERLRTVLRASAPSHWRWTVIDGLALGHSETPLATIPPALRFVNDGSVWEMPRPLADSITSGIVNPERAIPAFYSALSRRVGFTVSPSLKWMLIGARLEARASDLAAASRAAQNAIDAYPEDLEGYGLLSELALRRNDRGAARRALNDARRMLDRLELHDAYERERKRRVIDDALAVIDR